MKLTPETAGICGLFCGTCPSFGENCDGCLSGRVAPHCRECRHGFRVCSAGHGVTRCYECTQFPCERLEAFSKEHIVNGICHHTHVIDDLRKMGRIGVQPWVEEQTKAHTCPACGRLIWWYDTKCRFCFPEKEGKE